MWAERVSPGSPRRGGSQDPTRAMGTSVTPPGASCQDRLRCQPFASGFSTLSSHADSVLGLED